jgi:hypothetical protein
MQRLDKSAEILWKQRAVILDLREPKFVLRYIFAIPAFTGITLLASWSFHLISRIIIVQACLSVVYSIFTYHIWNKWKTLGNIRVKYAIIVIMIYDGYNLGCFSILSLILATCSIQWIDLEWVQLAGIISTFLYLFICTLTLLFGNRIVNYLIAKNTNPLPSPTKLVLTIPSFIIGTTIALGGIIRSTEFSLVIVIGLGYFCSFLLLPFFIITFYQILLMVSNHEKLI